MRAIRGVKDCTKIMSDTVLIFRHDKALWWLRIPTTSVTHEKRAVVATVVSPQRWHSVFPTNASTETELSQLQHSGLRRWSWSSRFSDLHTMISIPAPLLRSLRPACPPRCAVSPPTCLLSLWTGCHLHMRSLFCYPGWHQITNTHILSTMFHYFVLFFFLKYEIFQKHTQVSTA